MPSLPSSAAWYASKGFLVFPLRPGLKTPATAHGFKDASMSVDTVRSWWLACPEYNIGLSTGHLMDVIDVDGPDGLTSITQIEDNGQLPCVIGYVSTPRGYHLYTRATGDRNATGVMPGIDYRGHGGYVVAPPSVVDGKTYRWLEPPTIEWSST